MTSNERKRVASLVAAILPSFLSLSLSVSLSPPDHRIIYLPSLRSKEVIIKMSGLARTINAARKFSTTALRREGGCVPPGDMNAVKPPNILIYDGGDSFARLKTSLSSSLKPNLYVIYELTDRDLRTKNWHETTLLLVLRKPPLDKEALSSIKYYFASHKGQIWTASSSPWTAQLIKHFGDDAIGCVGSKFVVKDPFESLLTLSKFLATNFNLQVEEKGRLSSTCDDKASPLSLFAKDSHLIEDFLSSQRSGDVLIKNSKCTLSLNPLPEVKSSVYHIIVRDWRHFKASFDSQTFYQVLKTTELGAVLIHGEVMSSTSNVTDNHRIRHGLLVIADKQTTGKGRGGNQWLSPNGCAMFTFQIHISLRSPLGQKLPIIQHLVGIATAHGLHSLRKNINVRLKWPNDIYYGSSVKLGGILVTSSICGDSATVDVGVGFNLNNDVPMISLNTLLQDKGLEPISREEFIAQVLNNMEMLMNKVQLNDLDFVLGLYYKYWLHGDQKVMLLNSETQSYEPGIIKELDQYGFLIVQTETNSKVSVHPDGNSFDMVKGLIIPKNRH